MNHCRIYGKWARTLDLLSISTTENLKKTVGMFLTHFKQQNTGVYILSHLNINDSM